MIQRSRWEDQMEMMSLIPEGNRQIAVVIGHGVRSLPRFPILWLRNLMCRTDKKPRQMPPRCSIR